MSFNSTNSNPNLLNDHHPSLFVIDGGKRYFKFKGTRMNKIPSLVCPATTQLLGVTNDSLHVNSLCVTLKNQSYFVGDLALQSINTSLSVSKNYCLELEHQILLLTSIALANNFSSSFIFARVLSSLPINDFKQYRKPYIDLFSGKTFTLILNSNSISPLPVSITFLDFDVFPQGSADIFSLPESVLTNQLTAIINIGYRDVNCCVINWLGSSPSYESSLSFSVNSGIYEAELALVRRINQLYDADLSLESLPTFLLSHPSFDPSPEYQSQATKISKRIKQIWQNPSTFNQIFLSGGGGILLQNYFLPLFPNIKLLPIDDPQFGNVEGMWRIANDRKWQSRDEVKK